MGYGYWGPNLARNVVNSAQFELAAVCEPHDERAAACRARLPDVPVVAEFGELLGQSLDAVLIATPASTHFALCKQALEAGLHVLVEKPMATTAAHAHALIELAEAGDLVLMPGHTFLYSPAVNKVRDLISEEAVGEVYFITSSRMNLGNYQADGVICDLAPHDLAILMYWLDSPIVQVAAMAQTNFQESVSDTAFISLQFESGAAANLQVSWLAPRKVRQMMIVGSRRMIQYDDNSSDEAVRVYDRGMDFQEPENYGEYQLTYRSGDVVIPRVEAAEPLAREIHDFAQAILTGSAPVCDAQLGLAVVTALEAIELSVKRGGQPVKLGATAISAGGSGLPQT